MKNLLRLATLAIFAISAEAQEVIENHDVEPSVTLNYQFVGSPA